MPITTTHIKRKLRSILPKSGQSLLELRSHRSALYQLGWFRSGREGMCVDLQGSPLPWYTYPAIAFLEDRVASDAAVFEFGMGNSTLWWAAKTGSVASVEGDQNWFHKISPKMPPNVHAFMHPDTSQKYVQAAAEYGKPIDILVIDGRQRVECYKASANMLTDHGVVVWDNADRQRYSEGYELLAARGFKRLDFWGSLPLSPRLGLTSIFYRPHNLFDI